MTPSRLVYWLGLLTIVMLGSSQSQGGVSHFTSGQFDQETNSGRFVEVYTSQSMSQSCLWCATVCLQRMGDGQACVAFRCHLPEMTCDFYRNGDVQVPAPGVQLFWFQVTDVFHTISTQGHQYSIYLSSTPKTFYDARSHCQQVGGHLLQFDSLDEYDAVMQVASRQTELESYVGANDLDVEGQWVMDKEKTTLDPSVWLWDDEEPSNGYGIEHCASIKYTRVKVNDKPCDSMMTFLCERDLE